MTTGRPSLYSDELAQVICGRIADGETLRAVCRDGAMPARSTVHLWLSENEDFSGQYARAREARVDVWADEIMEIADESGSDAANSELIQRSKLRIDTRKWMMAKVAPKKYGEKLALGGDDDAPPIRVEHETELARRLAFILTKGAQAKGEGA